PHSRLPGPVPRNGGPDAGRVLHDDLWAEALRRSLWSADRPAEEAPDVVARRPRAGHFRRRGPAHDPGRPGEFRAVRPAPRLGGPRDGLLRRLGPRADRRTLRPV